MTEDKRNGSDGLPGGVRSSDVEPYTALRWVGTMFKIAAVFVGVAVLGETIAVLRFDGLEMLSHQLGELARTVVLGVLMWGGGDLVRLLIQLGNDIRAERILLARLVHRTPSRTPVASGPSESESVAAELQRREARPASRRPAAQPGV
jgi:hypothetical protein